MTTSSSEETLPTLKAYQARGIATDGASEERTPRQSVMDGTPVPANPSPSTMPQLRQQAMRRPPPLDIDAVRNAEARGSLTSLPDLIRRATQLATMIDKGKRPASRLDDLTMWFGTNGNGDRDMTGVYRLFCH